MKLKSVMFIALLLLLPFMAQAQSAREYIDQGITKATSGPAWVIRKARFLI